MSILQDATEKPKIEDFNTGDEVTINQSDSPGLKIDFSGLWELIKKPVGEGELEDYQKSPICFDGTRGLGRILWGLSGLLDYALKDIARSAVIQLVIGVFEWSKERMGKVKPDATQG